MGLDLGMCIRSYVNLDGFEKDQDKSKVGHITHAQFLCEDAPAALGK